MRLGGTGSSIVFNSGMASEFTLTGSTVLHCLLFFLGVVSSIAWLVEAPWTDEVRWLQQWRGIKSGLVFRVTHRSFGCHFETLWSGERCAVWPQSLVYTAYHSGGSGVLFLIFSVYLLKDQRNPSVCVGTRQMITIQTPIDNQYALDLMYNWELRGFCYACKEKSRILSLQWTGNIVELFTLFGFCFLI